MSVPSTSEMIVAITAICTLVHTASMAPALLEGAAPPLEREARAAAT